MATCGSSPAHLPTATVTGVSDDDLVARVRSAQRRKLRTAVLKSRTARGKALHRQLTAVERAEDWRKVVKNFGDKRPTAIGPLDGDLTVDTAQILLVLGQMLSADPRSDRRSVLTDVWPVLKYLTYFEERQGRLVSSSTGSRYVSHGRSAVADELGVAFSLLAGETWLRKSLGFATVNFVDVEQCLARRYRSYRVQQATRSKRRPDWIMIGDGRAGDPRSYFFTLESKGTHQPNVANHAGTLASAMEQVTGIDVDGSTPQGMAALSVIGNGSITVYSVDPEYPDVRRELKREDLQVLVGGSSPRREPHDSRRDATRTELPSAVVQLQRMVQLARYSRNDRALRRLGEDDGDASVHRVEVETHAGPAVGFETTFESRRGERMTIFQGLSSRVDSMLSSGDYPGVIASQAEWGERCGHRLVGDGEGGRPAASTEAMDMPEHRTDDRARDHTGDEAAVQTAVGSDGAVLRIAHGEW